MGKFTSYMNEKQQEYKDDKNTQANYAGISGIASTLTNGLPNWYEGKTDSPDITQAIYGNSQQDPLARLFSGHGSDMAAASEGIRDKQIDFSGVQNNQNLLDAWNTDDLQQGVNYQFGWGNIADNLTASAKGAAAGANFGPWGALIGGIAGGLANIGSQIGGKSRAETLNHEIERANNEQINSFYDTASSNNMRQLRTELSHMIANGGNIHIKPSHEGRLTELKKRTGKTEAELWASGDKDVRKMITFARNARKWSHANGGGLNGVTLFDEGGTHEQNPLGGIPQGIASDGNPNLVEEGEVKYKDYIYSARLKANKSLLKKNNLPEKYAGKSYAYIAEKLQKESSERPNDPISISTLESYMQRLQDAQEAFKAQKQEREAARIFNSMSDEEKMAMLASMNQEQSQFAIGGHLFYGDPTKPSYIDVPEGYIEGIEPEEVPQMHLNIFKDPTAVPNPTGYWANQEEYNKYYKDAITNKFKALKGNSYNADKLSSYYLTPEQSKAWTAELLSSKDPRERALGESLQSGWVYNSNGMTESDAYRTFAGSNPAMTDSKQGIEHIQPLDPRYKSTNIEMVPSTYTRPNPDSGEVVTTTAPKGGKTTEEEVSGIRPSWLRYAPAIGSGIGALLATINGPDYAYAQQLEKIAGKYNTIAPRLIGGYERYTPYDINLANNEAMAQQASAQRANRANGNRATQQAQAIALENAYEKASAARNLQWQEANEAKRQAIDKYNLGIDQLNAGTVQAYDRMNLDTRDKRMQMLARAAAARDAADTAWSEGISQTSTNFLNQLGSVGKDLDSYNMVRLWLKANPQYATKEELKYYGLTN